MCKWYVLQLESDMVTQGRKAMKFFTQCWGLAITIW